MPINIHMREIDYTDILAFLHPSSTAATWESVDGPDSGAGVDYYYENIKYDTMVYINRDQDWVTIEIGDETVFAGDYDDLIDMVKGK